MLEKLSNGKVVLQIQTCLRCRNYIELFKAPVDGETLESLLYKIKNEPEDLYVKFSNFQVLCPICKEAKENQTFFNMDKQELDLLNNTKLQDILVTVI